MKTNLYASVIALLVFAGAMRTSAQHANQTLSHLTSPTSVNVDLIPKGNGTKNLGSSSKSWNNVYANGSIFLDGVQFISNAGSFNAYLGDDAGHSTTTGTNNVSIGYQSLYSNTSGSSNVATGTNTLFHNVD